MDQQQPEPEPQPSTSTSHQICLPEARYDERGQLRISIPSWNTDSNFFNRETNKAILEMSIICFNLPNFGLFSSTNTQVYVYKLVDNGISNKIELGRTEVVKNNPNPKFLTKIRTQYYYEKAQKLKFEVFDNNVGKRKFLGQCETSVVELLKSRSQAVTKFLMDGPEDSYGSIHISCEQMQFCNQYVKFDLELENLPAYLYGFIKRKIIVEITRSTESSALELVFRNQNIPELSSNALIKFPQFIMKLQTLCNSYTNRSIKFEIIDITIPKRPRCLGSFNTCVDDLNRQTNFAQKNQFKVENFLATINNFVLKDQPSFLDHISNGTRIHYAVAIDFTISNGDLDDPTCLHYVDKFNIRKNLYQIALEAIGRVLKPHDSTKLIAMYGFGAKQNNSDQTSYFFALNGSEGMPCVRSVDSMLRLYRHEVNKLKLSGPTLFAPTIYQYCKIAKPFDNGKNYFVIIIITDGGLFDLEETKRAIVAASDLPISIIICGVGEGSFKDMKILDSDENLLRTSGGVSAKRDIVQFFKLKDYFPSSLQLNQLSYYELNQRWTALGEQMLYEIPEQLMSHMMLKGFKKP